MARHKRLSDDDLLDRLMSPLMRQGPDGLTLAQAGAAAGLSAATMVQRFGTRERMIEAILIRAWDRLDAATAAADAAAGEGAEGALALLTALAGEGEAEADLTDGLLLLREDIRNPALRARGRAWGEGLARALGRRLDPAPEIGLALGWQMAQVWQGALIWWAFTRQGRAEDYVQEALRAWCRATGRLPPAAPH